MERRLHRKHIYKMFWQWYRCLFFGNQVLLKIFCGKVQMLCFQELKEKGCSKNFFLSEISDFMKTFLFQDDHDDVYENPEICRCLFPHGSVTCACPAVHYTCVTSVECAPRCSDQIFVNLCEFWLVQDCDTLTMCAKIDLHNIELYLERKIWI